MACVQWLSWMTKDCIYKPGLDVFDLLMSPPPPPHPKGTLDPDTAHAANIHLMCRAAFAQQIFRDMMGARKVITEMG